MGKIRRFHLAAVSGILAVATVVAVAAATRQAAPAGERAANPREEAVAGVLGEPGVEADKGDDATAADKDGGGPASAALDELRHRAYPADSIPTDAASVSYKTFLTYGENKEGTGASNVNNPFVWDLIGPVHPKVPQVLTFSSSMYTASGRVTAMAITPTCTPARCRLWVAAAGGGIWRTDNPLSPNPYWVFTSSPANGFRSNAVGTIDQDPSDPTGNTLYAGTGEPNQSSDSEAGVGIYKTTDGGDHWTLLPGSAAFRSRSVSKVVVDPANPNILYVGIARGTRGWSSVTGGTFTREGLCTTEPVLQCTDGPEQAPLGVYRSTDGGQTFQFVWDGAGSIRGVNEVGLDPNDHHSLYAAAFGKGLWRCATVDGCDPTTATSADFKQIFAGTSTAANDPVGFANQEERTSFDFAKLPPATAGGQGATRIYLSTGARGRYAINIGGNVVARGVVSTVWRTDDGAAMPAAALLASQAGAEATGPRNGGGPGWVLKTERPFLRSNPWFATRNFCTSQCVYDNEIYTPPGRPDTVFVLGSYSYGEQFSKNICCSGEGVSNGRAVLMSQTAGDTDPSIKGGTFSDLSWDATPQNQPDQTHPDEHAIISNPNNPTEYFEGSDGGVTHADGTFDDVSSDCADRPVAADPDGFLACQRLLSRVPHQLWSEINEGLSTLQFQSVSLDPFQPQTSYQGGTQDNGTWEGDGQQKTWYAEMYGDGGQTGYNYCDPKIRFNTFFTYYTDENFRDGQPDKWVTTSGPLSASAERQAFYMPEVTDYVNCGAKSSFPAFQTDAAAAANANQTDEAAQNGGNQLGDELGFQYVGMQHVWRTVDNGGPEAYLYTCPEFDPTSGDNPRCGDWQPLADPAYAGPGEPTGGQPGDLTGAQYGADRQGGTVSANERNPGNANELWASTSTGRVFVSLNVNDVDPKTVTFCRLDSIAASDPPNAVPPPRFVSSIYPDPANPNRAWLSYSGYNSNTKDAPGHVFEVTFTGAAASGATCPTAAVWRDLHVESGVNAPSQQASAGDLPITDLVRDDLTGDLYAATDFGVLRGKLVSGNYAWTEAGFKLPFVEVPGITIDPCSRLLYAATHGRSVWRMFLPAVATAKNLKPCPRTP